jgi:Domain of unknown function (DUF4160)
MPGCLCSSGLETGWLSVGAVRTLSVPRISSFYGIDIEMYFDDHAPPHFHARYGGQEALILIETGDLYAGALPGRALRLVREWLAAHHDELARNFDRGVALEPLETIAPLP